MRLSKVVWLSNDTLHPKARNSVLFHKGGQSLADQCLLHTHNSPIAKERAILGPANSYVYLTNTASEEPDRSKSPKVFS
jgi:hypothetical protein